MENNFDNSEENSTQLLASALSGDKKAWPKLFNLLWPIIARVLSKSIQRTGVNSELEDATQNVFVHLLENEARRLRLYNPDKGMLESYVAKIAHNFAVDQNRRNNNSIKFSEMTVGLEPSSNESVSSEWDISTALQILSPREREVILFLFKDELSPAAIAERLGISAETVRSEKSHALKKLKKYLKIT